MKELLRKENRTMFLLQLGLIVCTGILLVISVICLVAMIKGCPDCGAHEWVKGNTCVVLRNGFVYKVQDYVCGECGYVL